MRVKSIIIVSILFTLLLGACAPTAQPAAQQTEIFTQIPISTDTSVPPTDTAVPPTDTPVPPTDTPMPTNTPTETPIPTDTPTITPTPGPFSFMDDFTTDSGGWEDCELCKWENGGLLMGPFDPTSNFHSNTCTGCGEYTYYKVSVDATYIDGQVDRFFGIYVGGVDGKQYYFGISPWQFYVIAQHFDKGDSYDILSFQWSGTVNGSYATNTFAVDVLPAAQPNTADYFFKLNGKSIYVLYGRPVVPSTVGLAMDWHAVTASYDNWSFVEVEP